MPSTAAYLRQRRLRLHPGGATWAPATPCWHCGAPDSRDPAHAGGCPKLPPVAPEQMLRIALACERGWARAAAALRRSA